MESNPTTRPTTRNRQATGRRQLGIAVALLVLTGVAGVAARQVAQASPSRPTPPDAGAVQLQATSADALSLRGRLDRGAVQVGGDGLVHLELVVRGADGDGHGAVRRPCDVIVVLDRSGSMGGAPLHKAIASIRELIGELTPDDRLALVSYANSAEQVLALEPATSANRGRWLRRISEISANGGTNMSAGLDQAHRLLAASRSPDRVARIVLLSDGHANQGDATPEGLSRRAGRAVVGEYVLSAVGVGQGFDERLMMRLADAGTGNFYYVPDLEVLAGIFRDEFASARETVAGGLEVEIGTPGGVEVLDAAGYPLQRGSGSTRFQLGSLFAGQERSLWVTLRVPAQREATIALGDVRLHYSDAVGERRTATLSDLPSIVALADEQQFVAELDAGAVRARHSVDLVNRVRQLVASDVSRGDYKEAKRKLERVEFAELEALGDELEDNDSYQAVQRMRADVERAAEAPAAAQPELQNALGKSLYEQGTDGRRKGAKR